MHNDQLIRLKTWFAEYTRSFLTNEATIDAPFVLKIDHTARVCENLCLLGKSIHLTDGQMRVAEAIGLFHDLGRFEQYRRYRTFNDRQSTNHASLGIDVLNETAVLDSLPADEKAMIIEAIRFHNAPALPGNKPPASMVFMRLIRDADKLDIWKIFADFYRHHRRIEPAIVQHLPDLPVWEEKIVNAIIEKRMAKFQDMKSLNDFKLLQLSWIFDLNFAETFTQAKKRGDLFAIARSLPDNPILNRAIAVISERLKEASAYFPISIGLTESGGLDKGTCFEKGI
ncbi:HD domain-containing protein [uncultured Desulfosarcina sp.]|uniref:HD domain-containing protein n=1 Tax=uncultured Desulfosarcina sp. TaxID=218289 RepID=UPI0029C92D02|nr:HD domain-containing protein [uncultured Desulfosarcina sp.]